MKHGCLPICHQRNNQHAIQLVVVPRGLIRSAEMLNKRKSTCKGSYFAPETSSQPNVQQHHESILAFKWCHMEAAEIARKFGNKSPSLSLKNLQNAACTAQSLHCSSAPKGKDCRNLNLCGAHEDHGMLARLGSDFCFLPEVANNNKKSDEPLHVKQTNCYTRWWWNDVSN